MNWDTELSTQESCGDAFPRQRFEPIAQGGMASLVVIVLGCPVWRLEDFALHRVHTERHYVRTASQAHAVIRAPILRVRPTAFLSSDYELTEHKIFSFKKVSLVCAQFGA